MEKSKQLKQLKSFGKHNNGPVVVYVREPVEQNKKGKKLVDSVNEFLANDTTKRSEEEILAMKQVYDKLCQAYNQQCREAPEKRLIAIALSYNKKTKEVTYGASIFKRDKTKVNESIAKDGIRTTAKKRYEQFPITFTITDPNVESFNFNDVVACVRKEMFTRGVDSNPKRVKRLELKRTPQNSQQEESLAKSTPVHGQ